MLSKRIKYLNNVTMKIIILLLLFSRNLIIIFVCKYYIQTIDNIDDDFTWKYIFKTICSKNNQSCMYLINKIYILYNLYIIILFIFDLIFSRVPFVRLYIAGTISVNFLSRIIYLGPI